MVQVFLSERANRQFEALEAGVKKRIKKGLSGLQSNPEKGKCIHPSRFWSLRCGDYRAIYELLGQEHSVLVVLIGHRKKVYDDFSKLL